MTPEEFRAVCEAERWSTPSDKHYPGGEVPPMHAHDFDATVLVTDGELHLVYQDRAEVLTAGDRCVVPAGTVHSEQPGPAGAVGLLATRAASSSS